ncbi:anion transporter [Microvenator marinus]|uniref:Anion transporter n=1 Tax=Microvenator marinus TaxID=2600177 RepID=A0A5B8XPF0_9DELT|nr:SLC13 family permease [Microvenator marinus]QED26818.1 anion transporter [Microvenator marinus]
MNLGGLVIFALVYLAVSARRIGVFGLDRPAVTLLGAVACVAFGVLAPEQAIHAVDWDTLLLLLGVMGMGAFLVVDGFFTVLQSKLARFAHSPRKLLGAIIWGAGILSAFITNDAVCVLGAPLVVALVREHELPPLPFLLGLATAANTGSVATLVGNPQNMLCGLLGGLRYLDYVLLMAPVALVGLALNHLIIVWTFRVSLRERTRQPSHSDETTFNRSHALTLSVIALTAVAYSLGTPLSWTAAAGFSVLMILHKSEAESLWQHIDWALLLFFASLFVVVEGLRSSGASDYFFQAFPIIALANGELGIFKLGGVFLVGSNLVSNVPFILVVQDQISSLPSPELGWTVLAMASTFAGNLTILGSAANIIVAQAGNEVGGFGFWQHLRVGLPIALSTTCVGLVWIWLVSP